MALEIKPTPILKGKSAERFLRLLDENKDNKVAPEKVEAMRAKLHRILQKPTTKL